MRLVLTKPIGVGMITTRCEARRRHRRAGRHGGRHDDHAERGGVANGGRGRSRCRHRRHGLRTARPPPQDAASERLRRHARRRGRPAVAGRARACPARRRGRRNEAATTRGWGRRPAGGRLTLPEQLVLADAQTSGGLLLATAPEPCRCPACGRRSTPGASARWWTGRGRIDVSGRAADPRRGPVGSSAAQAPTVFGNNRPAGSICTCNRRRCACPATFRECAVTELDGVLYKEIVEQGLREFPNECCGLIAAVDGVPTQGASR